MLVIFAKKSSPNTSWSTIVPCGSRIRTLPVGSFVSRPEEVSAEMIKTVKKIDENIKKYATQAENLYGSGGMKTKIEAAKICQLSGCYMVIANGNNKNPIKKILEGKKCISIF